MWKAVPLSVRYFFRTPEVVDHIENYVLGFLQGVLDALPRHASRSSSESDASLHSSPNEEGKLLEPRRNKIELALADRRRETSQEDAQRFIPSSKIFHRRNLFTIMLMAHRYVLTA